MARPKRIFGRLPGLPGLRVFGIFP